MGRGPRRERLVDLEAAAPRVLGRLARARAVAGFRMAVAAPNRSRRIFYDTDLRSIAGNDFDLVALRVAGRGRVALVGYEREGRFVFRERTWTAALLGTSRGPLRLPAGPLRERLLPLASGRPLAPVVVAFLSVRAYALRRPRGRKTAVARLELESWTLRRTGGAGDAVRVHRVRLRSSVLRAAALRDLAAVIAADFGLRPVRKGRMARVEEALGDGAESSPVPGGHVRPGDTMTLAARRVLSAQLRRLRNHDPGTREGSDPEELHDMRVATRRMRAALRTYGGALPKSIRRRLVEDLRWLGRKLGAVRDLDVLLERFVASGAAPALLDHLRRRRDAARDRLLPALRSRRYLRLVSTLDAVCRGWSVDPLPGRAFEPAALHAAARARRALERLVQDGDAAMERPEPERLHETRIRAKRLRYILEFHREAGGPSCAAMIRRLKAAQDHLGAHQDAVVAEGEVRAFLRNHGAALDDGARAAAQDTIARLKEEALALRRRWRGRWRRLRAALTGPPGGAALAALGEKKGDAREGVP